MEESTVVSCPNCGKKYKISPQQLGRTFKCVGCQSQFQAGAAPEPVETGEIAFADATASPPPFNPAPFNPAPGSPQVVGYNSGGMGGPKTSGMAIASLVCGILGIPTGCLVLPPVLALIFGIIGINQTKPGMARGRGFAIAGTVLGGIGLLFIFPLLISILLPSLNKARETANRAKCASNLHQIGLALILYQNENQQQYPPDLTTLMKAEQLTPGVFVCPSSNDTPAPTPAQLESGGHCSYKYIYPGPMTGNMAMSMGAMTAVVYEPFTDHSNDGTNILFADGHVEWFNKATALQYIPNH